MAEGTTALFGRVLMGHVSSQIIWHDLQRKFPEHSKNQNLPSDCLTTRCRGERQSALQALWANGAAWTSEDPVSIFHGLSAGQYDHGWQQWMLETCSSILRGAFWKSFGNPGIGIFGSTKARGTHRSRRWKNHEPRCAPRIGGTSGVLATGICGPIQRGSWRRFEQTVSIKVLFV